MSENKLNHKKIIFRRYFRESQELIDRQISIYQLKIRPFADTLK